MSERKHNRDPDELERVTVGIPRDLLERARNCVFHESDLTLVSLVRRGLEGMVRRYERNNGGRYPPRNGDLPRGRHRS